MFVWQNTVISEALCAKYGGSRPFFRQKMWGGKKEWAEKGSLKPLNPFPPQNPQIPILKFFPILSQRTLQSDLFPLEVVPTCFLNSLPLPLWNHVWGRCGNPKCLFFFIWPFWEVGYGIFDLVHGNRAISAFCKAWWGVTIQKDRGWLWLVSVKSRV